MLGIAMLPSLKKRWAQRLLFALLVPALLTLLNFFIHTFGAKMHGGYPYAYFVTYQDASAVLYQYTGWRMPRGLELLFPA